MLRRAVRRTEVNMDEVSILYSSSAVSPANTRKAVVCRSSSASWRNAVQPWEANAGGSRCFSRREGTRRRRRRRPMGSTHHSNRGELRPGHHRGPGVGVDARVEPVQQGYLVHHGIHQAVPQIQAQGLEAVGKGPLSPGPEGHEPRVHLQEPAIGAPLLLLLPLLLLGNLARGAQRPEEFGRVPGVKRHRGNEKAAGDTRAP